MVYAIANASSYPQFDWLHRERISYVMIHGRCLFIGWSRKSVQLMNKPRLFVLALQTSGSANTSMSKNKKAHKLVDIKLNSLTYCGHCSGIMWALSSQMQCKECKFTCHVKCSKAVNTHCGSISMIRLKIKFHVTPILALARYEPLLALLIKNDFSLTIFLGSIISEREEYAKCLINIFDNRGEIENFLFAVINEEVKVAADVPTLFRANSLASKAIDVYMKHVALGFMKRTIGSIISDIVSQKLQCEVDPTRLTPKDDLSAHWRNLNAYFTRMLDSILNSSADIPQPLRRVFHHLQTKVRERFPADKDCTITSVSGFIFLRFFAPAVLGPKLFGLVDGYMDVSTSRTCTLLAKSVQNLANLVEFGQKEPYMINMNPLIKANMTVLKDYVNAISVCGF